MGVYVDMQDWKSCNVEILIPATPTGNATTPDGFLLVYSTTNMFDAAAVDWFQTIFIRTR